MKQQKLLLTNLTLLLVILFIAIVTTTLMPPGRDREEQSAAGETFAIRPRIDVPVSLSLEEARVMIDAAVALVKAKKGGRPSR